MLKSIRAWILYAGVASALVQLFFFIEGLLPPQPNRLFFDVKTVLFNFLFAFVISLLLIPMDVKTIQWLNSRYPWKRYITLRIISSTLIAVLFGMLIGTIATLFYHYIFHSGHLWSNIATNLITTPIANIIGFSVTEGFYLFREWKKSLLFAERLEKENTNARFEILRQQLNPHFLFNCLSVLSGLVHLDADKAEAFINEFANIYRYVLETANSQAVPVREEVEVLKSYIFLQKLRFGESFVFDCQLNEDEFYGYLPPLSLQLLLENTIKHNEVSIEKPLSVTVSKKDGNIIVSNNKQPRYNHSFSAGIGLENLALRYHMLSNKKPEIVENDSYFSVHVPVLKLTTDGSSYH
jgi:two-component system LytT family sensor kinase